MPCGGLKAQQGSLAEAPRKRSRKTDPYFKGRSRGGSWGREPGPAVAVNADPPKPLSMSDGHCCPPRLRPWNHQISPETSSYFQATLTNSRDPSGAASLLPAQERGGS